MRFKIVSLKTGPKMFVFTSKMELTVQQNHFKIELKRLEDDLLNRLSAAHGNFLGDISLVEQLENTKNTATHIQCKVSLRVQWPFRIQVFYHCHFGTFPSFQHTTLAANDSCREHV